MQALKKITSLKRLDLNYNKLSTKAGEHLADAIASNIQLEELSLNHNNLHFSINKILQSLSNTLHLKKLNLNSTNISGLSSAEHLAEVIRSNACLEELYLGNNNFESAAIVILEALQRNNNLKVLDLSSNGISGTLSPCNKIQFYCKKSLLEF